MLPPGAQRPQWLTLHRPPDVSFALVREDGRRVFGGEISSATYDLRLGVFAERTTLTALQWKNNDEFDY
jgi:hypothetical protein